MIPDGDGAAHRAGHLPAAVVAVTFAAGLKGQIQPDRHIPRHQGRMSRGGGQQGGLHPAHQATRMTPSGGEHGRLFSVMGSKFHHILIHQRGTRHSEIEGFIRQGPGTLIRCDVQPYRCLASVGKAGQAQGDLETGIVGHGQDHHRFRVVVRQCCGGSLGRYGADTQKAQQQRQKSDVMNVKHIP